MKLSNFTCIPCQGGVPPLTAEEIKPLLEKLKNNWFLNQRGYLEKTYTFNDFKDSMNFANKITEIAEKEGHHPDLHISWGKCCVEIWTHKINGLTKSDFYLADKIEDAFIKE